MGLVNGSKLDRRVKVLRRGEASDDGHAETPGEWQELFERSASVKPRFRAQDQQAAGLVEPVTMSFWLRWDSQTKGILPSDAIELDGVRYSLVAPPIEIGRREGVELLAIAGELVSAGVSE